MNPGSVAIHVADTGHGLPTDDSESVFKAFHTTKPDGMGMGLGHQPIDPPKPHSGRLVADNTDDRGAVFSVIPATAAGELAVAAPTKPTVCIVDDDASVRGSLVALMECSGYRVTSFPSAEALLSEPGNADFDLLIVDVRLPGISGLELLERLVGSEKTIHAVVVTGHADHHSLHSSAGKANVTFLSKPCPPDQLLGIVNDALGS